MPFFCSEECGPTEVIEFGPIKLEPAECKEGPAECIKLLTSTRPNNDTS